MLSNGLYKNIQDVLIDRFITNQLFAMGNLITTEKNPADKFKISGHWIESFHNHLSSIESFKNIPIECELQGCDNKYYKHIYRNLLTGKIEKENLKILGRIKLTTENQYKFWIIPIRVPTNDEFMPEKLYQVLIPPINVEAMQKQIKKNKNDGSENLFINNE